MRRKKTSPPEKGLRLVSILAVIAIIYIINNEKHVPLGLVVIGSAYLFFSVWKLRTDIRHNKPLEKGYTFIVLSVLIVISGLLLLVNPA